mmetsp:Transcript_11390/g.24147  ORF Transcript_11390/g.24147 Transcript_11390/m.24147 type:complete len:80 (-) Transcript_11390:1-240(-)
MMMELTSLASVVTQLQKDREYDQPSSFSHTGMSFNNDSTKNKLVYAFFYAQEKGGISVDQSNLVSTAFLYVFCNRLFGY